MIDVFKATKIACCHAYGKRQIQFESYQNGKWGDKNTSKQFLWIKLAWKYYFLVEVIDEKKGKPWSRGINSPLPPSLSNDQPANADRVFPQTTSAFAG